jgi:hypothetical protein
MASASLFGVLALTSAAGVAFASPPGYVEPIKPGPLCIYIVDGECQNGCLFYRDIARQCPSFCRCL